MPVDTIPLLSESLPFNNAGHSIGKRKDQKKKTHEHRISLDSFLPLLPPMKLFNFSFNPNLYPNTNPNPNFATTGVSSMKGNFQMALGR